MRMHQSFDNPNSFMETGWLEKIEGMISLMNLRVSSSATMGATFAWDFWGVREEYWMLRWNRNYCHCVLLGRQILGGLITLNIIYAMVTILTNTKSDCWLNWTEVMGTVGRKSTKKSSYSEQNAIVESSSTKGIRDDLQTTLSRMKMAVASLKFINYQDAIHSLKGKKQCLLKIPNEYLNLLMTIMDFVCEKIGGEEELLVQICPVQRKYWNNFMSILEPTFLACYLIKVCTIFLACNAIFYCDIGCIKHNGRVERREDQKFQETINLNEEFDRKRIFSNGIVTPDCMQRQYLWEFLRSIGIAYSWFYVWMTRWNFL